MKSRSRLSEGERTAAMLRTMPGDASPDEVRARREEAAAVVLEWGLPKADPEMTPCLSTIVLNANANTVEAYEAATAPLRLATVTASRAYEIAGTGWTNEFDFDDDTGYGDVLGIGFLFALVHQWKSAAEALHAELVKRQSEGGEE